MNDQPNREVEVFTEAIQLLAGKRAAFLEQACAGDLSLRRRVEALIQTHEDVGDFLEQSPQKAALEAKTGTVVGEKAGDRIGRYKLLQQIGEGGCGVVYMAEQEEPVRRRVALKIIKPGMDTKNVIARFESERQALALMDHPNIAKVFDAGATASGRPYFVMELVRGVTITEYCDQQSLTTAERLGLFIQICKAVQHAHQKGIIHRDIKPSNILVTMTLEGTAVPVVIDFGIAKATTNQRLTDKTLFTAFEMFIGTPAYMSPEQAALASVDVDTRTDIYSLGVLLYELLTGSTPFDSVELREAGLDEIRKVIREKEAPRPSTRLSKMSQSDLTTVAQRRNSEPPRLIRTIRGDLDWIAMKALEKDRTRRYESAFGMALDVQSHLANEAISARPPSKLYKLQKAILKHKYLFVVASIITALLVVSLIMVSTSLSREQQARHEADAARLRAEADKVKAQTEAVKSQQVESFLEKMLQGVGPSVARGQDTTMLRGILDRTAASIDDEMTNQPEVEAELSSILGRVYFELANYDQAAQMHRTALELNQKLFGQESKEAADSLNDLGLALMRGGNLVDSERVHSEALRIRRKLYGEDNAEVATSLNDLATVYRHEGRPTEAEPIIRESLGIRQKLFGNDSLEAAETLHNLSADLGDEGRRDEAEVAARKMLAIRRKLLGPEDPQVASALADVAWAADGNNKLDEAIALEREALHMQQKMLGDNAPDVAKSLNCLAQLLATRGNLEEAHAVLQTGLSTQSQQLGQNNPNSLDTLRSLGLVLEAEGKLAEAEKAHRQALAGWRERGESETPKALSELNSLAHVLMAQKKFQDAKELLDESLTPTIVSQSAGPGLLDLRGDLEARLGEWREAAKDESRAFELQPQKHDRYAMLAALLLKAHNRDSYEQFCQRLLANFASTTNIYAADQVAKACLFLPPPGTDLAVISKLAETTVKLGGNDTGAMPYFEVCKALSEYRQGRFAEAAEWAQKPLEIPHIDAHGPAYAVLALVDWQLGKQDEARAMLAKGNEEAPATLPANIAEDPGNAWLAWLFARIQLDEAAALIRPVATVATHQTSENNK